MKTSVWFLLLVCFLDQTTANTDNDDIRTSLAELKVKVKSLERENQAQAAQLTGQKADIDKLKQQLEVKKVAFSASLYAEHTEITLGPFSEHTPLVFKYVVTNIGNAYNPNSGVFTAPVRGAYQFEWYIGVHGHPTGAELVKNGEHIFNAWEENSVGFGSSSQGVTLILDVGDVVLVRLWAGTKIFDNLYHHSTFSGRLLFPM